MKKDLKKLSVGELETLLQGLEEPRWRANEIRRWIYARGTDDIASMTSLPLSLRDRLAEEYSVMLAPGSAFGYEHHLRIGIGQEPLIFAAGLAQVSACFVDLGAV